MNELHLSSAGLAPPPDEYDLAVRKLATGILIQAFRDLISGGRTRNGGFRRRQVEALQWFHSKDVMPGSFPWVCRLVRLDAIRIREWIKTYLEASPELQDEMAEKLRKLQMP